MFIFVKKLPLLSLSSNCVKVVQCIPECPVIFLKRHKKQWYFSETVVILQNGSKMVHVCIFFSSKPPTPAKPKSSVPPEEDQIEEQNIWAEILKLEGRQSCNRKAEGFVYWLDKTMDSTVYEVKIFFIYNQAFLHLS